MLKLGDLTGIRAFTRSGFFAGLVVGLTPWGCASISFPYHFYNLQPVSYEGSLLGPTPADDLPLSICTPDASSQGKCVVMISEQFFKLKADYLTTKQALVDCQRR
jgi:hypothetical protein